MLTVQKADFDISHSGGTGLKTRFYQWVVSKDGEQAMLIRLGKGEFNTLDSRGFQLCIASSWQLSFLLLRISDSVKRISSFGSVLLSVRSRFCPEFLNQGMRACLSIKELTEGCNNIA